jgi:hypothetical protein
MVLMLIVFVYLYGATSLTLIKLSLQVYTLINWFDKQLKSCSINNHKLLSLYFHFISFDFLTSFCEAFSSTAPFSSNRLNFNTSFKKCFSAFTKS